MTRAVHPAAAPVRFRHGAAVVDADTDLLAVALSFVEAGLRDGDLVVLACSPETTELVRAELGERGGEVESDPSVTLLGARAPDALSCSRRYAERAAEGPSGRLRILSEAGLEDSPAGRRELQRFESVCNVFMRDADVSAMCLYDRRRLPREVVDSAARTHPELLRGRSWRPSPAFQDPYTFLHQLPAPREPVEDTAPVFAVDDAPALAGLRASLRAVLAARVPDREQFGDLHLGVSEVAANAFRHGTRPVSARVWADGSRLVCTVGDCGRGVRDPLAGFRPAHGLDLGRGGMGLWLARKLWDSVDLLHRGGGFTVRLSAWLRPPPAP